MRLQVLLIFLVIHFHLKCVYMENKQYEYFGTTSTPLPPDSQNLNKDLQRGEIADEYKRYLYSHLVGLAVYFVTKTEFFNDIHSCVGAIVSKKLIITAARCLYIADIEATPEFIDVHFDTYMYVNYTDANKRRCYFRVHNSKFWTIHPEYDPDVHMHDIAIIQSPTNFEFPQLTMNCSMNFNYLPTLPAEMTKELKAYGWNSNPLVIDSTVYTGHVVPLRMNNFYIEDCNNVRKHYLLKYNNSKIFGHTSDRKKYMYCVRDYVYEHYVFWRGSPIVFSTKFQGQLFTEFTGFMTDFVYDRENRRYYIIVLSLEAYEGFIMNVYNKVHNTSDNEANSIIPSVFFIFILILLLKVVNHMYL